MDIQFECPHCGQQIAIDESGAGRQVDCPRCQSQATVPQPSGEAAPSIPSESEAQYRCNSRRCRGVWLKHELLRQEFEGKTVLLCPKCRFGVAEIRTPASFWSLLPGAFAYPFHGNGIWILVSTTLLVGVLELAQRIMVFAGPFGLIAILLANIFVCGCLGMLLINIIRTTANDEEKMMEWPDISGFEDLWATALQLGGSALLVFLPAIICTWLSSDTVWHLVALGLWVFGVAYYPMALLGVAMFDSVSAVNPLLVLPSIVKTLRQYLLVIVLLAMIWLLSGASSVLFAVMPWGLKLVAYLPIEFYSLYSLAVAARLLGLLYRSNSTRLGWFE